jgi:hypothetical protein
MRNEGLPAQITGLWVGTRTRDYVFYRASLDGCHREQTIHGWKTSSGHDKAISLG